MYDTRSTRYDMHLYMNIYIWHDMSGCMFGSGLQHSHTTITTTHNGLLSFDAIPAHHNRHCNSVIRAKAALLLVALC